MSVPHVLCNKHLIFSKIGAQQIVTNASQEHSYAVVLVHAYWILHLGEVLGAGVDSYLQSVKLVDSLNLATIY
jgi:hypothetical protein